MSYRSQSPESYKTPKGSSPYVDLSLPAGKMNTCLDDFLGLFHVLVAGVRIAFLNVFKRFKNIVYARLSVHGTTYTHGEGSQDCGPTRIFSSCSSLTTLGDWIIRTTHGLSANLFDKPF